MRGPSIKGGRRVTVEGPIEWPLSNPHLHVNVRVTDSHPNVRVRVVIGETLALIVCVTKPTNEGHPSAKEMSICRPGRTYGLDDGCWQLGGSADVCYGRGAISWGHRLAGWNWV